MAHTYIATSDVTFIQGNPPALTPVEVDSDGGTVLSGGYAEVDEFGDDVTVATGLSVITSRPNEAGDKWEIVARSGGTAGSYVRAYAVCLK